ncbi:MAG: Gfo/Idh/MocA family oxidoreductase [Chloroflexi bacterium]|nr:Gfo/Idh/MocA family oxidoreductase [Chloroflexota bacterium]
MTLKLGMVGAGGMGMRHAHGYIELCKQFDSFRLVAVCDRHAPAAESVASVVEKATGDRPGVFTDLHRMLDEANLDALDIVTDTRMHHRFAVAAFEHGVHVMTEKPMGVTIRACHAMRQAAQTHKRVLSIAENYRRDPMNRLAKALLDAGAIGRPNFMVRMGLGGGSALMHNTGWRALKSRAGSMIIEQGVHDADLMIYFMGDIQTVYAETGLFARIRRRSGMNANLARFYEHRVEEEFAGQDTIELDQEDSAFAVMRFASGAVGHYAISNASHGHAVGVDTIHGAAGTMIPPRSRTGQSPAVKLEGAVQPLTGEEMLSLVPDWELNDITAPFWGGVRRMASYDMPFDEIDRKLIAIEYAELARAITGGAPVEVGPETGIKALGLAYATLESGMTRQPVRMADILEGSVEGYQAEVNAANGL